MTTSNSPRVIAITGANNGIGLALTESLLKMGNHVATLDLDIDNLDPSHPSLLPFRCDVTQPPQIQSVIDEVASRWGRDDRAGENRGRGKRKMK